MCLPHIQIWRAALGTSIRMKLQYSNPKKNNKNYMLMAAILKTVVLLIFETRSIANIAEHP
jgi:hypothetical protein